MNNIQIRAQAETDCSYLLDDQYIRIRVAAQGDNKIANTSFTLLDNWAEKAGGKAKIMRTGSFGYYDLEPVVIIEKPGSSPIFYAYVTEEVTCQLIEDCLEGDNPRPDLALCIELPLFKLQKRIALRNCGFVDSENINHYIAGCKGYSGLAKALQMSVAEVIEEIRRSGIRDRGNAGDQAAEMWTIVQEVEEGEKVVVCSAVDNDLQARTARLLLEGDPHAVLEGLLITAYAVGASCCVVAVPAGCGGVINNLGTALAQMKEYSLLGANILDSGFSCDIQIREISPSLVAGEETALLCSLEGKQAMPYLRGGSQKRLRLNGKPAIINNVETFANVSAILQRGSDWFAETGTDGNKGTKVISLSGAVVQPYTVEVPLGIAIDTMVKELGGGISGGRAVKAVQFGGPTGAYFSAEELTKLIAYETLGAAGSLPGFGIIEVVADNTCAVEMTEQLMALLHSHSCGKCVYCREGTLHMSHILKDIMKGEGTAKDLDLLKELGEKMQAGSICGFGQAAANPVMSSLKLFQSEYDFHIKQKRCLHQQDGKGD